MSELPKVTELQQTCGMCPSQWEGVADARCIYIRFRWGHLTAEYVPPDFPYSDKPNELIYSNDSLPGYDEWSGVMDTDTMMEILSGTFDFSEVRANAD